MPPSKKNRSRAADVTEKTFVVPLQNGKTVTVRAANEKAALALALLQDKIGKAEDDLASVGDADQKLEAMRRKLAKLGTEIERLAGQSGTAGQSFRGELTPAHHAAFKKMRELQLDYDVLRMEVRRAEARATDDLAPIGAEDPERALALHKHEEGLTEAQDLMTNIEPDIKRILVRFKELTAAEKAVGSGWARRVNERMKAEFDPQLLKAAFSISQSEYNRVIGTRDEASLKVSVKRPIGYEIHGIGLGGKKTLEKKGETMPEELKPVGDAMSQTEAERYAGKILHSMPGATPGQKRWAKAVLEDIKLGLKRDDWSLGASAKDELRPVGDGEGFGSHHEAPDLQGLKVPKLNELLRHYESMASKASTQGERVFARAQRNRVMEALGDLEDDSAAHDELRPVGDAEFKEGDRVWANPITNAGRTVKGVVQGVYNGQVHIKEDGSGHTAVFHPANVHASDELPVPIKPVGLVPLPSGENNEESYAPRPVGDVNPDPGGVTIKGIHFTAEEVKKWPRKILEESARTGREPWSLHGKDARSPEDEIKDLESKKRTNVEEARLRILKEQQGKAKGADTKHMTGWANGKYLAKTSSGKFVLKSKDGKTVGPEHATEEAAMKYADQDEAKATDKARAKDGSTPEFQLTLAKDAEIGGDRARALDSYRAAASGFRRAADTAGLHEATEGITACQALFDRQYDHPGFGKTRVCDSAEQAVRVALERTRAGEHVAVNGCTVSPVPVVRGRANDSEEDDDQLVCESCKKKHDYWPGGYASELCKECSKKYEGKKKAKDDDPPAGTSTRVFKDEKAARKYADQLMADGIDMVGVGPHPDGWEVSWHPELGFDSVEELAPVGDEHEGFAKLKGELAHEKGVKDPAALAASIGRKKYGAEGMAKKAAAGRAKDEELKPVGDAATIEGEAQYKFSHGIAPRGDGSWCFSSKKDGPIEFEHRGSYGAAKVAAVKWAAQKGLFSVWLLT